MTIALTLEQTLALKPCDQAASRIKALLEPGRAYTAREALAAGVPVDNLLWVLCKLAQKDARLARLERHLAADYAERVLHVYEEAFPGDMRPRNAIQAARDYADGKIDANALTAARDAADACYAAAAADASSAAFAAHADAADAAYAAAKADAADAARAAALAAADYYAEREWQINRLMERLEESQ